MNLPDWTSPGVRRTHTGALASLHPYLRTLWQIAQSSLPEDIFLYVFIGQRGKEAQESAYRSGNSNAKFGQSYHNLTPALAFDCVPMFKDKPREVEWKSERTKKLLAQIATHLTPLVEWGGSWKFLSGGDIYHFQPSGLPKTPPESAIDGYRLSSPKIPDLAHAVFTAPTVKSVVDLTGGTVRLVE